MYERPNYLPEMPVQRVPEDFIPGRVERLRTLASQEQPAVIERPRRSDARGRRDGSQAAEREPAGPREASPRINFTGRLGTHVMVRQTQKGQDLARFALAIPTENDAVRYETIMVFGKRVRAVQEFQKGDAVEVIGYLHEREVTGRDGTKKMRRELYATVVRSR